MKENIKKQIIKNTLKLISAKGFDGFSVDELTEAAGCSKGIVFYHYTDRNRLVLEAFREFLEYYNTLIIKFLKETMTAGEMLDLMNRILLFPEQFDDNGEAAIALGISAADHSRLMANFYYLCMKSPEAAAIQKEIYTGYYNGIRQIIDYGAMTGEFRLQSDIRLAIYGFSAMIDGLLLYRSLTFDLPDNDSLIKMINNYWNYNLGLEG